MPKTLLLLSADDPKLRKVAETIYGQDIDRVQLLESPGLDVLASALRGSVKKEGFERLVVGVIDYPFLKKPLALKRLLSEFNGPAEIFDANGYRQEQSGFLLLIRDYPCFLLEIILGGAALTIYAGLLFVLGRLRLKRRQAAQGRRSVGYIRAHFFRANFGGTLAHTQGILSAFDKAGYDVHLVSSDPLSLPFESASCLRLPPSLLFNNFGEIGEIAFNFRLFINAYRRLRNKRPAFLYFRNTSHTVAPLVLSKVLGIPLVLEFNSSDYWRSVQWNDRRYYLPGLLRKAEIVNLNLADLVVTISDQCRLQIEGISGRQDALVLPNGVDLQKFNDGVEPAEPRPAAWVGKTIVGFSGTFMAYHGTIVLAESICALAAEEKLADYHFLFFGDGPDRERVEEILAAGGCSNAATFYGVVPYTEVERYLALCDAFAAPHDPPKTDGDFFGSPIKLFEYMAMSKAIVASRVGQQASLLEDGVDAVLVEPGDVEDLKQGLLRLADAEFRQKLGRNALSKVTGRHTWDKNVSRILEELC